MNTIIVSSIADVVTACNNNNECLAVTGATAPKPVTKDDENENEELKDLLIDPGSDKKENMANNSAISSCTVDVNKEDEFTDKRVAKIFSVISSNKLHQNNNGRVNRIFFGTVEKPIGGKELKLWKIIFDDGDEDILTHVHLLNAIILYDQNKKYDKQSNSLPLLLDEEMDSIDIASTRIKHGKKKAKAPPKRGKKTHSSKVPRARELEPISVGPPDEELSGGWPAGWVKKVFGRKTGTAKDRYWYTPKEKYKLRSMVEVKKFMAALARTNGDEIKARTMTAKK